MAGVMSDQLRWDIWTRLSSRLPETRPRSPTHGNPLYYYYLILTHHATLEVGPGREPDRLQLTLFLPVSVLVYANAHRSVFVDDVDIPTPDSSPSIPAGTVARGLAAAAMGTGDLAWLDRILGCVVECWAQEAGQSARDGYLTALFP